MMDKRQHYVPEFYLKRFAASDGKVWVSPRGGGTPFNTSPTNIGVEGHLYAPGTGPAPKDDAFEKLLSIHVDGLSAPHFDVLATAGVLSPEARWQFAYYLAIQEYRTPRMRDLIKGFASTVISDLALQLAHDPEYMRRGFEEMGTPISEDDLGHIIEGIKQGAFAFESTNVLWLQLSTIASELAKTIYAMDWAVARVSGPGEYLTSDSPIVKVLTDPSVPKRFAGGWISPSAETTFALDPEHCLVVRPSGPTGIIDPPENWFADLRRRTVAQAHRFVISRSALASPE